MMGMFLTVTLVFSPLAAIMAFLIVYDEYRHHFEEGKTPLKMGLRAALVTFILFILWLLLFSLFFQILE
jgi:hypothetical protein